jgi:hypothetical protein
MRSRYPPFAKNAKDGAPAVLVMQVRSKAWATRPVLESVSIPPPANNLSLFQEDFPMQLRVTLLPSIVLALGSTLLMAQAPSGPCAEKAIRDAVQNHSIKYTEDTFFWSGAFDKPLIGTAATMEASKKVAAERKHEVPAEQPQRIVVSSAGDMAYEYGTGSVSYVEVKTGKHTSFQIAYVRAWRSDNGECRAAASMFKPIESTIQTK